MSKILIRNDQCVVEIPEKAVARMMESVLKSRGCAGREVSVVFVDDETIQTINKKYMNRDKPTNVLSFSYDDEDSEYPVFDNPLLGEIVISTQTCARNAKGAGMKPVEEVLFCLAHGLAHLLGYDHENVDAKKAREMEKVERELYLKFVEILCADK